MHRIIRTKAYEAKHGPHFDDEHARKAVSKMENEDGSKGQHWSLEETSALANQYGIRFDDKFNKYDWYVALNMVYSDYYRVIVNMTGSNNAKYFVELAKAWLCDKDIDEGKMWYYYIYIMCDKIREAEDELFDRNYSRYEDDDDDEAYGNFRRGGRMGRSSYNPYPFNRSRVRTIDNFGIPSLRTIYVTTDTTNNTVTYGICPRIWRQLPCEGMFLLNIVNTPATTVTAASLVSIDTTRTANQVNPTTTTSTGARALINGSGDQMATEEISTGNRYLIYYNKANGIFQTVNHIVLPAAANA